MFRIDLQSRVPIYEQMKKKIIELVLNDVLSVGDSLPSVRVLAREVGINPNTVQKAYQELERCGIITTVAGRGSIIADFNGKENPIAKQAEKQLSEAAAAAKISGIELERALEIIKKIYKGGENCD
ncbi:MAG: GntR family transcriptional regulator [Oscillospiraceae bacterium]|nr:GntR family transcriptional regulator [Oscillospiraceae bacterium]